MCGRRSKKKNMKHSEYDQTVWYCWTEVQLAEACEEQSPGKNELAEEQMKQFHYPLKWFWKKKSSPGCLIAPHPEMRSESFGLRRPSVWGSVRYTGFYSSPCKSYWMQMSRFWIMPTAALLSFITLTLQRVFISDSTSERGIKIYIFYSHVLPLNASNSLQHFLCGKIK